LEAIAENTIELLQFLLPGFLAAWVFRSLTAYEKPSQFESVIQALIFTLVVGAFVYAEKSVSLFIGRWITLGQWSGQTDALSSSISATLVGAMLAWVANSDLLHAIARKLGITKQTSFPSEWFGALLKNVTFVVLHLKDDRRLYGWPREWPSQPGQGYFLLDEPSWVHEASEARLTGVASILVNVTDVKWVEFLERTWKK
jgi:hypothetical protein